MEVVFSLFTLALLEIILGIDNLVFISILSHRLPHAQQKKARRWGLAAAWITRLLLLAAAVWVAELTQPLFTVLQIKFSVRDLFFIAGGLFLLVKSVHEIHQEYESLTVKSKIPIKKYSHFFWILVQIALFDIIFSLDSILTAIGLTQHYWIMATAITMAIIVMLFASDLLNKFIQEYRSIKMLALSFLLLISTALVAEGIHFHIPRGYLYFAVCFSLLVELLNNLILKKKAAAKRG